MKKLGMIWAIACLMLIACFACAEEYTGKWYASSYTDAEGLHQPVLQSLPYVPCVELLEDDSAKITVESLDVNGVWERTEDGRIAVTSLLLEDIYLTPLFDYEPYLEASMPDAGFSTVLFRKLDDHSPIGEWTTAFATNGKGKGWYANGDLEKLVLNEDGTGEINSVRDGEITGRMPGSWIREGNDVVFSVLARDEEGGEISVPYRFFWMDDGQLYYATQWDQQDRIIWINTNSANEKKEKTVVEISELVNTVWEPYGTDREGCRIAYAMTGEESSIGTFSFHEDGGICSYSTPAGTDDFTVEIDGNEIHLSYPGYGQVYAMTLTEDRYLKLPLSSGRSLLFRQK